MAIIFLSLMAIIFLFLLVLCMSSLFIVLRRFRLCKLGLPPGNLSFPLIGETLEIISAQKSGNPESFIDLRVNRYGKIFTTHLLGEITVFSTDPDVNRFILLNEGRLFESSYTSSFSNLLGKHSLILLKGNLHKKMYSLTVGFMNTSSIRDNYFEDIDRLIRLNLNSWKDNILLLEKAKKMTFELTVKQLMSIDPGEWTENLRKHYLIVVDGFFALPLPFSFTTYGKAICARSKVADAIQLKVREKKIMYSRRVEEGEKKKNKDMLKSLLEGEGNLSDEEIVDFILALIFGGYETTSTMMTLAIKFLTETPLALAQLKEEHEEIRGKKGYSVALEWSDYQSMPFTQCVINELLRISNITAGVFRKATTNVSIKGYTIPKNYKVFVCSRAVHMNEEYFKRATSFNPWRWQQDNGNEKGISCSPNLFTPFGGGPRLCPGYELARVEISVFIHHFITAFNWNPSEEDKLIFFPTTRTLKKYPIDLHRRNRSLL